MLLILTKGDNGDYENDIVGVLSILNKNIVKTNKQMCCKKYKLFMIYKNSMIECLKVLNIHAHHVFY